RLWQGGVLARFFSVNTDIFFRTLCIVAVQVAFTSIGSGLGVVILSANALLLQFNTLLSYVMDGFAYAGEALGGRYYGMGDRAAFLRLTRALIRWCAGLALCFSVAYIIGGDTLIRLLTNDAATIEAARRYVVYVCLIPIVGTAGFLLDGLFIGTTATRGMLLSVFSGVIIFFLLQSFLVKLWGNDGLWVAFAGYFLVRGLVQALYFRRILPPMQQEVGGGG
ncbi:MAG: MATE family efflux transporter, partial [Alloprevotella tannerae]|nr:MATE family efflux transporter [Alloprevotella tannerae]